MRYLREKPNGHPQEELFFFFFFFVVVGFVLPSVVIISLGEEGAGRYAGCLLVCPRFVIARFARRILVAGAPPKRVLSFFETF